MLDLQVVNYASAVQWTWRLADESGQVLAEHQVRLDAGSTDVSLLTDLYGNRWRLPQDPRHRALEELRLLKRVGEYAAAQVLGDVGLALLDRAPVTVRVSLPPTVQGLLAMPIELARWPASLADNGVVLLYSAQQPAEPGLSGPYARPRDDNPDRPGPLRALAIFALPETSAALGLVKERRALERLMRDGPIARGETPVELTVLQYGATRESVLTALADHGGWDIIHLAGHGGPGRFYLESSTGGGEPIETSELISWLEPLRGRVRLVTLSACESGVAGAAEILGVPAAARQVHEALAVPSLGYEIASALDCTVLATRYPVDDRFSVEFIREWYEALLRDAMTVTEAMRTTLPGALRAAPWAPFSAATWILFGGAADLRLASSPSPSVARTGAADQPAASVQATAGPPIPDRFVGRAAVIRSIGALLMPDSNCSGLVVLGMPGIGKSTACAEVLERYAAAFDQLSWHRASHRDTVRTLTAAITNAETGSHERIRSPRALIVIDDVQKLLTSAGAWRDAGIAAMIAALLAPGASSRVLLISDTPIADAAGARTLVVPMMSRSESEWLAVELAEEHQAAAASDAPVNPGRVAWLVCRGHPGLIGYCNGGDVRQGQRRQRRLWHQWDVFGPLSPASETTRRPLGRHHPGGVISAWAADRAAVLAPSAHRALAFLSVLEQADRNAHWAGYLWDVLGSVLGAANEGFSAALAELEAIGLAEVTDDEDYLLHPAVASVGRELDEASYELTALAMLTGWRHEYQAQSAQPDGGHQGALAYLAASEVPYLMRLHRWEEASAACERAISHDNAPKMAARLLPYAVEIVAAARGTALETKARFVHAVLAAKILPSKGIDHFQDLLDRAAAGADQSLTLVAAHSLGTSLARTDPLQARRFLELAIEANAAEPMGPWLAVQLDSTFADILGELGAWPEALAKAEAAMARLAELENSGAVASGVNPASLWYELWLTAAQAARQLGRSTEAAVYQESIRRQADNSADRSLAETQFNNIDRYLNQGDLDYSEQLLRAALATFTAPGDIRRRGLVWSKLALVEHRRGRHSDAIEFARQAIRASYQAGETLDAAAEHSQLAGLLAAGPPPALAQAPAHILAAAVIHLRVSGKLIGAGYTPVPVQGALTLLALCRSRQPELIPATQAELRGLLLESAGVDIDALLRDLERIPVQPGQRAGTFEFHYNNPAGLAGDSVTDVLCLVQQLISPDWIADTASWQASIDVVLAAAQGKPGAMIALRQHADQLAGAGWGTLAAEFLRFAADPVRFEPGQTVDPAEIAIMRRIAAALTLP